MLFALRFNDEIEKQNVLCGDLETINIGKDTIKMILSMACKKTIKNPKSFISGTLKKAMKNVTQVFQKQNNSIVKQLTDLLGKGKVDNNIIGVQPSKNTYKTVIVFVLGGGTYQEARDVIQLGKKEFPKTRFYYGSSHFSTIQNIIDELENESVMKTLGDSDKNGKEIEKLFQE